MDIEFIKRVFWFVFLCLAQALVLNHIHLFGYATPLLYVYLVIIFRRNHPRWAALLWGFAMGLGIDMFSNTPGVTAGAMTLLAFLQPYILYPFIPRDSDDNLVPSIRTLGVSSFAYYTIFCVLAYNIAFFSLEMFTFYDWAHWLRCIAGSTVLTSILILAIESLRSK